MFVYSDVELELPLHLKWTTSRSLELDFSSQATELENLAYGLWRRLSFYLLDAVPVFFYRQTNEFASFSIVGGWANGHWVKSSAISSSLVNTVSATLEAGELPYQLKLCPQTKQPTGWIYHPVQVLPDEFSLATETSAEAWVTKLVGNKQFIERLEGVAFLEDKDEGSYLFYESVEAHLHRGEDFQAIPRYGFSCEQFVISMRAHPFYGVDSYYNPIVRKNCNGLAENFEWRNKTRSVQPKPKFREHLLFSLIDINAALLPLRCKRAASRQKIEKTVVGKPLLPKILGLPFGSHLEIIDGLPITTSLGMARLTIRAAFDR
jgi:hypothetical protein